ncbi:MAG: RHS repeat-associated core domain-containing protein [Spirochaetales bacterium]|nr:RHS repeat-associated core domain-containing protein [Spirochaetales bacterium]
MYYRYDANGNVTEERQGGHSDDAVSKTFIYSTPVTGVTSANQAWGWSRDDDTETDSAYCRQYSWDEENRLTGTADRNYTTSYSYDHEGERTVKYSNLGETLYFDSMWLEADTDGTGRLRQTKNIYIGETRIASKLNYEDGDIDYEETHTFYYHTDHLSFSNVITDYQGDVYEHMEYTPYGEKWILDQNDSSKYDMIPYRFTGKEWDEETGLYYMSARYQNPETSRWVSSDPAGWELLSPMDDEGNLRSGFSVVESVNRYSYVSNNPVRYIGPTGLKWVESEDGVFTATEDTDYLADVAKQAGYDSWKEAAKKNYINDFYDNEGNWQGGDFSLKGLSIISKDKISEMKDHSASIAKAMDSDKQNTLLSAQESKGKSLMVFGLAGYTASFLGGALGNKGSQKELAPSGVLPATGLDQYFSAKGGKLKESQVKSIMDKVLIDTSMVDIADTFRDYLNR